MRVVSKGAKTQEDLRRGNPSPSMLAYLVQALPRRPIRDVGIYLDTAYYFINWASIIL